ncbi:MAG: hypothetical protein FJ279_08935 [Planctomycetes bacterium]|nr:hypothetical protein [Planctomycetota bacterium]MBM4082549.1 hypothetical protein [Planctomycetota bacterium]MBM4085572.1 hypothetical protein [Planctomycetota bacterium]
MAEMTITAVSCVALIVALAAVTLADTAPAFPGPKTTYRGYDRYDFTVDGCKCIVVAPKSALPGNPWVWRAEFFDSFPQVDLALLAEGFYLAYMNVGNITVIVKKGFKHHPHGLDDPAPVVKWIRDILRLN